MPGADRSHPRLDRHRDAAFRDRLLEHAGSCRVCRPKLPQNVSPGRIFGLLPAPVMDSDTRSSVMTRVSALVQAELAEAEPEPKLGPTRPLAEVMPQPQPQPQLQPQPPPQLQQPQPPQAGAGPTPTSAPEPVPGHALPDPLPADPIVPDPAAAQPGRARPGGQPQRG